MKCPNCNKEISNGLNSCPYCATPIVANTCSHCGSINLHRKIETVESDEMKIFNINGVTFKMIHVEGGTFTMGEGSNAHQVTLSSYYIGETPVTQALWKEVTGKTPSYFKGDQRPVEQVSWDDCQDFIKKLNAKIGKKFRLLTDAEWEYAARDGTKSKGYLYAGSNDINEVAWYMENSNGTTHPVGQKKPNELGLYDMSGNVWEWCQDWHDGYIWNQTNPTDPTSEFFCVHRGGSWSFDNAEDCRMSQGRCVSHWHWCFKIGFRLALSE